MLLSPAFLLAATLLAITPGPGIAYVVARTAAGGKAEGVASCAGTAVGGLVHVLAAALGLSVLIAQVPLAFSAFQYLGAAYLVFLGIKLLASSRPQAEQAGLTRQGVRRAFLDGAVVEVLNIKTALFFLAFIPQFVLRDQPLAPQFLVLGAVCVALNTTADLVAVFAAHRLLKAGSSNQVRALWLSRVSGATMLVLGIYVALKV